MLQKWQLFLHQYLLFSSTYIFLSLCASTVTSSSPAPTQSPPDAVALLAFKSEADLHDALPFSPNTTATLFCRWPGVQCARDKIVRLVIQSRNLGGVFASNTLTRLDQLRVLSLQNNSLWGPLPDLAGFPNLKALFLDHNYFSGSVPPSLSSLRRLRTLDFSSNNLSGPLPAFLTGLDRLYYLRLDRNWFTGPVPALNQSSLQTFNVSGNNLTGAVPITPTLLRFGAAAFSWNPGLCGEIVNTECHRTAPFFGPAQSHEAAPPPARSLGQSTAQEVNGVELTPQGRKPDRRTAVVIGFASAVFVLICSLLCFVIAAKKQGKEKQRTKTQDKNADVEGPAAEEAAAVGEIEEELEKKVKGIQVVKSGSLMFCAGESQVYSLEQLMRASAELLGKGTVGTTYKAVLDNRLIVSVKRLDGGKVGGTSREVYERHLEAVGALRHPNLVPLRAYFQAKEERLLVYDYQPNGSLFSLIHGSKSTRAKPLHWTSCLKIAEDVAQGLSYIHQAWRLVHGNLKSSNVLLGPDFEACLTDYCLSVLASTPTPIAEEDPDAAAYKAPETRMNSSNNHDHHKQKYQPTSKSDVYAFGILLVELLTGKPPSQHLVSVPDETMEWVMSIREDDHNGEGNSRMGMLLEVAIACSSTSPEQRPTMWQVLKMLQEIKETVSAEEDDNELMNPQVIAGVPS